MDSFTFDDIFESEQEQEQEKPQRATRTKQAKRKWREIEAIKEKQRLKKELDDIDMTGNYGDKDVDF